MSSIRRIARNTPAIINDSLEIRSTIRQILAARNGRRIAISAFVGKDVVEYIGPVKGLVVYCWPNPIATNPQGVRDLINAGAAVYFVPNLHMKLFWSEGGGYAIGSPNLSKNALGGSSARGLLEIASYRSDCREVDIDEILSILHDAGAKLVTPDVLQRFESDYVGSQAGTSDNVGDQIEAPSPSFDEYLLQKCPASWGYVPWSKTCRASSIERRTARASLERSTGAPIADADNLVADSIAVSLQRTRREWLLTVKVDDNGAIGRLKWIFPHCIAHASGRSKHAVAIEVRGLGVPSPPFELSSGGFRRRFAAYVHSKHPHGTIGESLFDVNDFMRFEREHEAIRQLSRSER